MHAGGTIVSGLVGLLFRVLLGHKAWIARPLAVATSVGLLAVTASPFPPGNACTTSKPCPHHTSTCVYMHACVQLQELIYKLAKALELSVTLKCDCSRMQASSS